LGLLLLVTACGAVRLVPPEEMRAQPRNLDFEGGTYAGAVPNGWYVGRGPRAGTPDQYSYRLDHGVRHTGRSSLLISVAAERPRGHGGLGQCLYQPEGERRRVRLSGYVKTSGVGGDGASLYIVATDDRRKGFAFQNMAGRRARGTSTWTRHAVEIHVGEDAVQLCFGFFLEGPGSAWVDDLSLRTSTDASR
jgi:hypothetical protein